MEKYTIKKYMIKINKKKNRTLNAHYSTVYLCGEIYYKESERENMYVMH